MQTGQRVEALCLYVQITHTQTLKLFIISLLPFLSYMQNTKLVTRLYVLNNLVATLSQCYDNHTSYSLHTSVQSLLPH